jgi:hypothetical protein
VLRAALEEKQAEVGVRVVKGGVRKRKEQATIVCMPHTRACSTLASYRLRKDPWAVGPDATCLRICL